MLKDFLDKSNKENSIMYLYFRLKISYVCRYHLHNIIRNKILKIGLNSKEVHMKPL